MSTEAITLDLDVLEPRRQQAIREMADLIQSHYPSATFRLRPGVDDPDATYLAAIVDIDDPDAVMDLVAERLLALQIDEDMPVYVLPIHPPAWVAQNMLHVRHQTHAEALLPRG